MKNLYYFEDVDGSVLINELIYQIHIHNAMLVEYRRIVSDNAPKDFNGIYNSHYNKVMRYAQYHPDIKEANAQEWKIPKKMENYRIAFDFLIHVLIERTKDKCILVYDEDVTRYETKYIWLSSTMLHSLLGDKYVVMLYTLLHLGIIKRQGTLDKKEYSLTNTNWESKSLPDNSVYSSLLQRYESYIQKVQEEEKTKKLLEAKERLGDVYEPYMEALTKLKCRSIPMRDYIKSHKDEFTPIQYDYYMWLYNRYEKGEYVIQKVDDNHRIYTILTQTPSHFHSLLPFTNVKYEVDLSNCHPMLFNLNIMQYYHTLPSKVGKIDSHFFYTVGTWKKSKTKKYPKDVEEYMHLTSTGKFWDELLNKYTGCSRKEIKPKMFADVFYAKNLRICPNQTYGKDFQRRFPTIMKIIRKIRHYNKTILANFLMQLESRIIQNAMGKLYDEGFVVLNIHDAIVVLDVPENKKLTEQHVKDVLLKSVQKYGLSANAKIEHIKR